MTTADPLRLTLRRIGALEGDLRGILATHEASADRVLTLEGSYAQLGKLSLDQEQLFRESLAALEARLFQAAHVLAWAAFMDFLHQVLIPTHLAELNAVRPKWNLQAPEDLRDWGEFAVIEAGKDAGAYNKTIMKALHGLLNRRNECAHPSEYFPDLNTTLGYVGELFMRIEKFQAAVS